TAPTRPGSWLPSRTGWRPGSSRQSWVSRPMRIVVGGSSGFIGTALVDRLRAAGHDIVRLVRRDSAAPDEGTWRPSVAPLDPSTVDGADAVVNLAGVGVGTHRWNAAFKALIRASRVNSTEALAAAVAAAKAPHRALHNGTAVGIDGDTGTRKEDERWQAGRGKL